MYCSCIGSSCLYWCRSFFFYRLVEREVRPLNCKLIYGLSCCLCVESVLTSRIVYLTRLSIMTWYMTMITLNADCWSISFLWHFNCVVTLFLLNFINWKSTCWHWPPAFNLIWIIKTWNWFGHIIRYEK